MMSSDPCNQWRDAIDALVEGRFDEIEPDEMARVEAHLNECDACADRLADVTAAGDAELRAEPVGPTADQWGAVWDRIDAGSSGKSTSRRPRRLSLWAGLSAAAVFVAAVGLWQVVELRRGPDRTMHLADNDDVQIESLEVYGDATTIVLEAGDDAKVPVIWVMEEQGA